jgi:hypothetical protein
VLVQSVDALHLALEVLLFVMVRQRLSMLLQMATIVEGSEQLCEIFDGRGRLSLVTSPLASLETTSKLNSMVCFIWNGVDFMAHIRTKMLDPIEETLLPVAACV